IKERFAALATDALRAQLLDLVGYKTQILEFIDIEHTPKNLLIRAVKRTDAEAMMGTAEAVVQKAKEYLALKQLLNVRPYLEQALMDRLTPVLSASK
ncbi:MAG: SAM-dependent methyltransferase, partial [Bacilli bacterium]|nr:SAM-dependent methyltransferase [Bacilli bacterium]